MRSLRPRLATSLGAILAVFAGSPLQSATIDPGLPGTHHFDGWDYANLLGVNNPGFGSTGFVTFSAWPGAIGSGAAGSGDAGLIKLSNGSGGGPYPASASLYFGSFGGAPNVNGGQLQVSDATPLANVKNIVFQVEYGGSFGGFDFLNGLLPVLNYNGGSQGLAPTFNQVVDTEPLDPDALPPEAGGEDSEIKTYLLQWDVSALPAFTAFNLRFNGVEHSQIYSLRLDQYDTFQEFELDEEGGEEGGGGSEGAPEPSAWLMQSLFCLALEFARRWRKSAAK